MTSPWAKVDTVVENLAEIMSEQYACNLQEKEYKKYGKKIHEELQNHQMNNITSTEDEVAAGTSEEQNESDLIPEDVLNIIRDSDLNGSVFNEIDSDAIIAEVLQQQFDRQYNEDLKRLEKQQNKQSKVSISYDKYLRNAAPDSDSDDDEFMYYDNAKKDWDRFETNEKLLDAIPKCGFKIDKEGEMITKHDPQLCGIRNASKIMNFPPEFSTGDGAGFDMKLSNKVFNQLKTYSSQMNKTNKMHDRKETFSTATMGVDGPTKLILYKFINNQTLERINGIISTGKEAIILHAYSDPNYVGKIIMPRECAVKVFKFTLNEFKQRDRYIKDDWRFKNRLKDHFSKQNNRFFIEMWAEKEMRNMIKIQNHGINCPNVIVLKKHILVMSFIGNNHNAAPKLKDARLSDRELSIAYEQIVDIMCRLYNEVKLIHADFSEYNILWHKNQCWVIDVAQAIEPEHPSALEFLMRDVNNIITFFKKRGLPNIMSKTELFEKITGLNSENLDAGMLERIHTRGISIKDATAPNLDECPDELKPLSFAFDLAWDESLRNKKLGEPSNINNEIMAETKNEKD